MIAVGKPGRLIQLGGGAMSISTADWHQTHRLDGVAGRARQRRSATGVFQQRCFVYGDGDPTHFAATLTAAEPRAQPAIGIDAAGGVVSLSYIVHFAGPGHAARCEVLVVGRWFAVGAIEQLTL